MTISIETQRLAVPPDCEAFLRHLCKTENLAESMRRCGVTKHMAATWLVRRDVQQAFEQLHRDYIQEATRDDMLKFNTLMCKALQAGETRLAKDAQYAMERFGRKVAAIQNMTITEILPELGKHGLGWVR